MPNHTHEWVVMFTGDSETESVEIFALCIADAKAGKNFITPDMLITQKIPEMCMTKLSKKEIEEILNQRAQNV